MKTKNILGLVAIVAVAVAMAFNVTVSNKKTDTASLLALRNVEALAQAEADYTILDNYVSLLQAQIAAYNSISAVGKWWNTSSANLTGLQYKGTESYGKKVYDGETTTNVPAVTSQSTNLGIPWVFGYSESTAQPHQTQSDNYAWVKCCKDSYDPTICTGADWRC